MLLTKDVCPVIQLAEETFGLKEGIQVLLNETCFPFSDC
jgi:hypothetical protein